MKQYGDSDVFLSVKHQLFLSQMNLWYGVERDADEMTPKSINPPVALNNLEP
jgi:hypothetical protein